MNLNNKSVTERLNDTKLKEKWFVWSYVLCLCVEPIMQLLNIIGISGVIASILTLGIVYVPMLIGFVKRPKFSVDFFIIIVFIVCVFTFTLLIFPEYKTVILSSEYLYSAVSQIFSPFGSVFMFLFVRNIKNPKEAVKPFIVAMLVMFFYNTILAINSNGIWEIYGTKTESLYSMGFSYSILLPVLTFFTWGIRKKSLLPIIFAVIGSFEILVYGSRGALVVVVFYFALYLFWAWKPRKQYVKVMVLFFIVLGALTLMFGSNILVSILDNINTILESNGYSSRTLRTIIYAGSRTEDRFTEIWPNTIDLVFKYFGMGCGVYADHYYLGGFCHNFILEILVDFGVLLGGCILFYIFKEIIYILRTCKDDVWQSYFLIIMPFWIIRLMFSSSFWYEGTFWAFWAATRNYRLYIKKKDYGN